MDLLPEREGANLLMCEKTCSLQGTFWPLCHENCEILSHMGDHLPQILPLVQTLNTKRTGTIIF